MPDVAEWAKVGLVEHSHSSTTGCPVCDAGPEVLVALRHPAMRRYVRQLLEREHGCWSSAVLGPGEPVPRAVDRVQPAVVVIDPEDLPACGSCGCGGTPLIVIGREHDASCASAAAAGGAAAFVARDRIVSDLGGALRAALGCHHDPCPTPEADSGRGLAHLTTRSTS